MTRKDATAWIRSLHPVVKGAVALGSGALFLMTLGTRVERIAAAPARIDTLAAAESGHRAFHDSTRSYMQRKDERDERILCLLQAIAEDTSPLPCERGR